MKRGQATIFIILGIVIFVIVIFLVLLSMASQEDETKLDIQQSAIESDVLNSVESFVEDCMEPIGWEAINLSYQYGGYLYRDVTYLEYRNISYNYLCYSDGGESLNYFKPKEVLERNIGKYVIDGINKCIDDFDSFPNFNFEKGSVSAEVDIKPEKVYIFLNYPLNISKDDRLSSLSNFSVVYDVKLGEVYNIAKEIVLEELKDELDGNEWRELRNDVGYFTRLQRDTLSDVDRRYNISIFDDAFEFRFACKKPVEGGQPGETRIKSADEPEFGFLNLGDLSYLSDSEKTQRLNNFGVNSEKEYAEYEANLAKLANAKWVRVDFEYPSRVGEFVDLGRVGWVHDKGLNVIGTIHPETGINWDRSPKYLEDVGKLVRIFDYIGYWQIGDEPDKVGISADEYVDYFVEVSDVVKGECENCKILLGGASDKSSVGFYEEVLVKLNGLGKEFDIFDYHFWSKKGDEMLAEESAIAYFDMLNRTDNLRRDFWVTEMGTYSGEPTGYSSQTEEDQARFFIKVFALLFSNKVDLVVSDLVENYKFEGVSNGYFDHTGLVYDGFGESIGKLGVKKKSYDMFRILADKFTDVNRYDKIPGFTRYKFIKKNDDYFYIAWGSGGFTLGENQIRMIGVDGVEYLMDGPITIQLTDDPVVIEPV